MMDVFIQSLLSFATEGVMLLFIFGYGFYFWIEYMSVDKSVEKVENSLVHVLVAKRYKK